VLFLIFVQLLGRARVSVSKSGVRTSGVLNFNVRYARANLDVTFTPDNIYRTYAADTRITNCMNINKNVHSIGSRSY